jgi:hypothetical protein
MTLGDVDWINVAGCCEKFVGFAGCREYLFGEGLSACRALLSAFSWPKPSELYICLGTDICGWQSSCVLTVRPNADCNT